MLLDEKLNQISDDLREGALAHGGYLPTAAVPSRHAVEAILQNVLHLMFPTYFEPAGGSKLSHAELLYHLFLSIKHEIGAAFALENRTETVDTESLTLCILSNLPRVQEKLFKDAEALFEGDPAATGPQEVLLSYPGFLATAIYRFAHEFYLLKIPYLSRMMTEYAHSKTGIDIHAGATIGEYFFIDHGTGIVIGETTVIGDRVKLYQGVTLGAKSFELDENGNPQKGIKRHPNIGNSVIIYANATILGGKTTIGDRCVIGANVWIKHSVPADTVVSYNEK